MTEKGLIHDKIAKSVRVRPTSGQARSNAANKTPHPWFCGTLKEATRFGWSRSRRAAAEKVARYRHAQLSAVRLAGDISGKMDDVSLDELLVTIKQEWAKLSPLIDLDAVEEPEPQATANRLPPPKGH